MKNVKCENRNRASCGVHGPRRHDLHYYCHTAHLWLWCCRHIVMAMRMRKIWHLKWWQWRWCWWWLIHWLWGNLEYNSLWEKDGHWPERDESHRGKWEWLETVQLTRDQSVTTIILYQSSSSRRMLCKALHCSPLHCFVTALKNTKMYFTEYTDVQLPSLQCDRMEFCSPV